MRRIIFLSFLLTFLGYNIYAQETETMELTSIKFNTYSIDYGVIDKGSDGTKEFKFTNTGDKPLKIASVKSSCGCTIPTYPKESIMPGESSTITVKYNTNRPGRFSKSVSIFTNTHPERSVLRIKGEVVDPNVPGGAVKKEKNMMER